MDVISAWPRTSSVWGSRLLLIWKFTVRLRNRIKHISVRHDMLSFFFVPPTVKPFMIRGPQNQTAVTGSSVIFQCRVGGEPLPDVLWRRTASGGNMPLGKQERRCLKLLHEAHIALRLIQLITETTTVQLRLYANCTFRAFHVSIYEHDEPERRCYVHCNEFVIVQT